MATDSDRTRTTRGALTDDELLQKARSAQNGYLFGLRFDHTLDHPLLARKYDDEEGVARALLCNLTWWARHDREQVERLFRRSEIAESLSPDDDELDRLVEEAMECVGDDCYDPNFGEEGGA